MKAHLSIQQDEDGLPETVTVGLQVAIMKPLRFVAYLALVFVATLVAELADS